jgi:hypothetical protein
MPLAPWRLSSSRVCQRTAVPDPHGPVGSNAAAGAGMRANEAIEHALLNAEEAL